MADEEIRKSSRQTGPALEAMYQFTLWLVPTVEKFPKKQKFLLGDRIQSTAIDILERLIEATYTRSRATVLASANLGNSKIGEGLPDRRSHQRNQSARSTGSTLVLWGTNDQGRASGGKLIEISHVFDGPTIGRQPCVVCDEVGRQTVVNR